MYSKNGSIPKSETDGTEGWIEVADEPACPDGKEVVWWYPPGWVIRDPKPDGNWSWSQSQEQWVEHVLPNVQTVDVTALSSIDIPALTSADLNALTSADLSFLTSQSI
jgi:hypothetical protein